MSPHTPSASLAFTMLEILLALSIGVMLLGPLYLAVNVQTAAAPGGSLDR